MAAVRAVRLVGRARPRVVVAVGGYASLAGSVGALVHRVPLVLVNVDAVPGAANRLLGRFAAASAVGWEGNPLPRAVVTGTPVRPQISAVDRSAGARSSARAELGLPGDRHGGRRLRRIARAPGGSTRRSTGWRRAGASGPTWRSTTSSAAGTGRRTTRRPAPTGSSPAPTGAGGPDLVRVPYEERMPAVYAAADLVVCRAGAMTVAELAAAGRAGGAGAPAGRTG